MVIFCAIDSSLKPWNGMGLNLISTTGQIEPVIDHDCHYALKRKHLICLRSFEIVWNAYLSRSTSNTIVTKNEWFGCHWSGVRQWQLLWDTKKEVRTPLSVRIRRRNVCVLLRASTRTRTMLDHGQTNHSSYKASGVWIFLFSSPLVRPSVFSTLSFPTSTIRHRPLSSLQDWPGVLSHFHLTLSLDVLSYNSYRHEVLSCYRILPCFGRICPSPGATRRFHGTKRRGCHYSQVSLSRFCSIGLIDRIIYSKKFAGLSKSSSCTTGENACVGTDFAQCVNGKFVTTSCGSGETWVEVCCHRHY